MNVGVLVSLVNYRCEYLLEEKGQDFVHQIQARFPRLFEQVEQQKIFSQFKHLVQNSSFKTTYFSIFFPKAFDKWRQQL